MMKLNLFSVEVGKKTLRKEVKILEFLSWLLLKEIKRKYFIES